MKIPNICSWTFGVLLLGLLPNPAMGFTLDLFSESDNNTADFYNGGVLVFPNLSYTGQIVAINQDTSSDPVLVYSSEESDSGLSSVFGGSRHLKIATTSGSNEATLAVGATASNILNLDTDTGTSSVATIVWNGSTSVDYSDLTTDAALGLDLTSFDPDDDSIAIEVQAADQIGTLNLTLYDGMNTHTEPLSIPAVSGGLTETLYFNYSTYEANSIDIENIEYIAAEITGPEALDVDLNFVETVEQPVPFEFSPSLGIIMSGTLLGVHMLKKKMKIA